MITTNRQTQTARHRQIDTDRYIDRHTHKKTDTKIDRQIETHTIAVGRPAADLI